MKDVRQFVEEAHRLLTPGKGFRYAVMGYREGPPVTTQASERFYHRGTERPLFNEPLEPHFARGNPRLRMDGEILSTGLYRGYIGTWAVRRGVLHLTDLQDLWNIHHGTPRNRLTDLFPDHPGGVPADWCTDRLRVGLGELDERRLGWFGDGYPRDLWLTVHAGRVVFREVIVNRERRVIQRKLLPRSADVFPADEFAFLRHVADDGWSDVSRLVYADHLDERGDSRGELIRHEIERVGLSRRERRKRAERREELYRQVDWVWIKAMGFELPVSGWSKSETVPEWWDRFRHRDPDLWVNTLADAKHYSFETMEALNAVRPPG